MENINWFTAIEAIFAAAGLLGGTIGMLVYGRTRAIIDLQREEIEAQKQRLDTLTAQNAECIARVKAAEAKANTLENVITQAPSVERLAKMQSDQHQQVVTKLTDLTTQLGFLVETLSNNNERDNARHEREANASK